MTAQHPGQEPRRHGKEKNLRHHHASPDMHLLDVEADGQKQDEGPQEKERRVSGPRRHRQRVCSPGPALHRGGLEPKLEHDGDERLWIAGIIGARR